MNESDNDDNEPQSGGDMVSEDSADAEDDCFKLPEMPSSVSFGIPRLPSHVSSEKQESLHTASKALFDEDHCN